MFNNRRFFNITASGYDFITAHEIWRAHIRETAALVVDPSPKRIIDLGCGPGVSAFVLAELFPDAEVIGIDISESMITRAHRHHTCRFAHLDNLHFQHADIYKLPFEPQSFDLATGHSFLYLLPERGRALTAIQQALTPGGQLILLEPNAHGSLTAAGRRVPLRRFHRAPLQNTRFALSMVLWRIVSKQRGQMTAAGLQKLFNEHQFAHVAVETTLHGLGLHVTGHAHDAQEQNPRPKSATP